MLKTVEWNLESIGSSDDKRKELTTNCVSRLSVIYGEVGERFFPVAGDLEDGGGQRRFAETTVDAFFDNDLFNTMKIFLANASGSFGLCIQSSLDVNRQHRAARRRAAPRRDRLDERRRVLRVPQRRVGDRTLPRPRAARDGELLDAKLGPRHVRRARHVEAQPARERA